jgi:hypothetical protein
MHYFMIRLQMFISAIATQHYGLHWRIKVTMHKLIKENNRKNYTLILGTLAHRRNHIHAQTTGRMIRHYGVHNGKNGIARKHKTRGRTAYRYGIH